MKIDLGTPPVIADTTPADEALVLDGLTGEPMRATVDGQEALVVPTEQAPLVEVSIESLVHDLTLARRRQADADERVRDAKTYAKDCAAGVDNLVRELCRRDSPEQAQLHLAADEGEEEGEDASDD